MRDNSILDLVGNTPLIKLNQITKDLKRSKKYPMVVDFLPKPISKEMLEFVKIKFNSTP